MEGRIGAGRIAAWVSATLLALMAGGCDEKVRGDIKKTLPRPGGGVAALLVKQETWEDFVYRVYMREGDGSVASIYWADRSYAGSPDIEWKDLNTLMIRMKCGDIGEYTNHFEYFLHGQLAKIAIGLEGNQPCKEPSAYHRGSSKP